MSALKIAPSTVFPGFGGQTFIPDVRPKIEQVRKAIDQKKLTILVEADGGVKADNTDCVVRAGAEVIVSGSGILGRPITLRRFNRCAKPSVSFRRLLFSRFRVLV
jgi:ribulose-phosphate 3-epimerase